MKYQFIKLAIAFFAVVLFAFQASAQYTITFEDDIPGENMVFSNGQSFTLTNQFLTYSDRNGRGYERSYGFVDNINGVGLNQINSIKTSDGAKFSVKNLWFFTSKNGGNNPSADGSLIIRGKLAGVVVFTITKTSGFNNSYASNNGFTFLNLATEGGADNSNLAIDELEFVLQGNFNYLAFDNFTWSPITILPITLVSYSATLQASGNVLLNWETSSENNSSYYIVERSADGRNYQQVAKVKAARYSAVAIHYSIVDTEPLDGINYYRLTGYDLDGKSKQLGIKLVKKSTNYLGLRVYPNPATGSSIYLKSKIAAGSLYIISDISGKMVKTGSINLNIQQINISNLSAGNYFLKMNNGEVIKWIKD